MLEIEQYYIVIGICYGNVFRSLFRTSSGPAFLSKRYNQCILCTMGYHVTYKMYAKLIKSIKVTETCLP